MLEIDGFQTTCFSVDYTVLMEWLNWYIHFYCMM